MCTCSGPTQVFYTCTCIYIEQLLHVPYRHVRVYEKWWAKWQGEVIVVHVHVNLYIHMYNHVQFQCRCLCAHAGPIMYREVFWESENVKLVVVQTPDREPCGAVCETLMGFLILAVCLSEVLLWVTPHSGMFVQSELLLGVSAPSGLFSAVFILLTISGKEVQWAYSTRLFRNFKRRPLQFFPTVLTHQKCYFMYIQRMCSVHVHTCMCAWVSCCYELLHTLVCLHLVNCC